MLKWILKKRLIKRMQLEYKKTDDIDYSDCGFPVAHLGRDLYFTFLKLLDDEKLRKWSLLSEKNYRSAVIEYYEKVEKDFENGFYM